MKKNYFISLQNGILALISAALLFSCGQIEPFEMERNDQVLLSTGVPITLKDCKDHCISDAKPESYQKLHGKDIVSWGNGNHSKTIIYDAYNTETEFIIVVNFVRVRPGVGDDSGNLTVSFNGVSEEPEVVANESTTTFKFNLPVGWKACDVVTFGIVDDTGDVTNDIQKEYKLYGVCQDCEEGLTVDLTCGETNTATFTFFAEEAGAIVIQGGLNANAKLIDASSNVLTRNMTHPAVINGATASVTRWEGEVDACEEITVTVSWTGPASIGDWTAKRDGETLGEVLRDDVACDD